MLNAVKKVTRIRTNNYNPLWLFIIIGIFLVFIIVIIIVLSAIERKDEAQYDEIHYQSKDFRLLNTIMKEAIKYYRINRIKNTLIFFTAIIACFIGLFITVFHSNLLDYIFGTITEFISATFFWIYKQCQKEEKYYFDKLFYLKKVLITIILTNSEKNIAKNDKIIDLLIDKLNS